METTQGVMVRPKPLKVLMVSSGYPRSREDNAGIFVRYLAKHLTQHGLEVHVLAPADRKAGSCIEGNIHVHRFQYFPLALQRLAYGSGILHNLRRNPLLWIEVPFFVATMAVSLLRLLRRENPDLIHAHWVLPQGLLAVFSRPFHERPVVITAHGTDAFSLKGNLMENLKRLVLRSSNAWTSNTRATSEAFGNDSTLPKPHIIPMGVDVERFHRGERKTLRRKLPEDELLVLFVGRLVEQKGVDDLLRAFSLLPAALRAKTTLWVVGDGEQRPWLQQYTEDLGISSKACFWGQISNDLLPDFYAAADLFVAPSGDTEGQGVVLLEASASGLCVLATRVGGINEVIEDGQTGVLVEPRNPKELAGAMARLLGNPKLRKELAENASMKAKDYRWKKIAQDFGELYGDVIERAHKL